MSGLVIRWRYEDFGCWHVTAWRNNECLYETLVGHKDFAFHSIYLELKKEGII